MDVLWSEIHPDESRIVSRKCIKNFGLYELTVPAGVDFARGGVIASGGQGDQVGGNAASARRRFKVTPGEILQVQVGQCGTGGSVGDTWIRRKATGEVLCYSDRGKGQGGVQGQAIKCIGDVAWSGVANVGSGSDAAEAVRLGLFGRPAGLDGRRAPGPGGGGQGLVTPFVETRLPAGQGYAVVEFFAGDPGPDY